MIVKQRYNIMLNPRIVEIIDREARKADTTRSSWISDVLSQYISESGICFSDSNDFELSGQVEMGDCFD